jgi:hypothetical protein
LAPDLPPAYYLPRGENRYLATDATTSPWDAAAQHGGPPTALLGACIDAAVSRTDMRLARISMDFLGPMPKAELRVEVEVLRPGRRTSLTEAVMWSGDRRVAVGRGWHLAVLPPDPAGVAGEPDREPDTAGREPDTAGREPDTLPAPQPQSYFDGDTDWGYGRSIEWRAVSGGFEELSGAADVWTRVRIPLVEGRPLTGLDRFLIVADSANGLSAPLSLTEWWFIPPGVTAHLHRHPVGDWVRLTAQSDAGEDGIGLTEGILADRTGRCGTVTQPLLVAPRSTPPRPREGSPADRTVCSLRQPCAVPGDGPGGGDGPGASRPRGHLPVAVEVTASDLPESGCTR